MASHASLETTFNDFIENQDAQSKAGRETAFQAFSKLGIPSKRQDHWKYINWSPMPLEGYQPLSLDEPLPPESMTETQEKALHLEDAHTFVFINGQLVESLSSGLKHSAIALETLPNHPKASSYDNGFAALNDALSSQRITIKVKAGETIEDPIVIIDAAFASNKPVMLHSQYDFHLEAGAKATCFKQALGLGHHPVFINQQITLTLDAKAELKDYDIQHNHTDGGLLISHTAKVLAETAKVESFVASFGSGTSRHEQSIALNGSEAYSELMALHTGSQQQERDITVTVAHNAPACNSQTVARGVFDDKAKGSFTGKIFVQEKARETNADLENKNILLSMMAEANSRPQLEVYNDEVKCSHGSTVGHLEPDALFYLQSRGLPQKEAKEMLINAFLAAVTESIEHPVIKAYVNSNLPWSFKDNG